MAQNIISSISSSSSSCARSVADISDHGLPTLSVVSYPDELIVGGFFSCYEIIQTVCVFCCLPLLLVPQIFPLNICFSSPSALFICPKKCSCLFLMVLRRDLLFDFFSVHDILIILPMYHISTASSLLSRSFVNVQHSHPYIYIMYKCFFQVEIMGGIILYKERFIFFL